MVADDCTSDTGTTRAIRWISGDEATPSGTRRYRSRLDGTTYIVRRDGPPGWETTTNPRRGDGGRAGAHERNHSTGTDGRGTDPAGYVARTAPERSDLFCSGVSCAVREPTDQPTRCASGRAHGRGHPRSRVLGAAGGHSGTSDPIALGDTECNRYTDRFGSGHADGHQRGDRQTAGGRRRIRRRGAVPVRPPADGVSPGWDATRSIEAGGRLVARHGGTGPITADRRRRARVHRHRGRRTVRTGRGDR
jgi:hypothetical protein